MASHPCMSQKMRGDKLGFSIWLQCHQTKAISIGLPIQESNQKSSNFIELLNQTLIFQIVPNYNLLHCLGTWLGGTSKHDGWIWFFVTHMITYRVNTCYSLWVPLSHSLTMISVSRTRPTVDNIFYHDSGLLDDFFFVFVSGDRPV